jgi:AAA+ ATPase superfamily predicted ATPase
MFCNRKNELAQLDQILRRRGAQFVAVYGRRRIGKTALLCHWLETSVKDAGIYWVAHRTSSKILLDGFSATLAGAMQAESGGFSFTSWEAAFKQVAQIAEKRSISRFSPGKGLQRN